MPNDDYGDGCTVHPTCLTCPLPACVYDSSHPSRAADKALKKLGRTDAPPLSPPKSEEQLWNRIFWYCTKNSKRHPKHSIQDAVDYYKVSAATVYAAIQWGRYEESLSKRRVRKILKAGGICVTCHSREVSPGLTICEECRKPLTYYATCPVCGNRHRLGRVTNRLVSHKTTRRGSVYCAGSRMYIRKGGSYGPKSSV